MSKLTVTTIRRNLSDIQLAECIAPYQTDENLKERINVESLSRTGFSRKINRIKGMDIETIVKIEK